MRKRIITLLTVLLLSTTGLSAPFALPVYADETEDIDDESSENDEVKIKYNTKLTTTDANVVSKYHTALNFAFRTTDDLYYSYSTYGVYSAAEWWQHHTNNNVELRGVTDAGSYKNYWESYLYNVRDLFDNGEFFHMYTGKTNTVLVKENGTSRLTSKFKVNPDYDYEDLKGEELDWRWFVNWGSYVNDVYKGNGKKPKSGFININQITPSDANSTKLAPGDLTSYKKYYNYILDKIKNTENYKTGIALAHQEDSKAVEGWGAIEEAYNHVAVIKFLQDSKAFFKSKSSVTHVFGASDITWSDIEKTFNSETGIITPSNTTAEKLSLLLGDDNPSGNRYFVYGNSHAKKYSGTPTKVPNPKNIADKNYDSSNGYYLYIYMKSGVARNTTECVNMVKVSQSEEEAAKWWKSGLTKDQQNNINSKIDPSKAPSDKTYFNIYDAYMHKVIGSGTGAFVKTVDKDDNNPDNTKGHEKASYDNLGDKYYRNSYGFWDGDVRKPIYKYPTYTKNLAANYSSAYSTYLTNVEGTKAFKVNGSTLSFTDQGSTPGDFAVQLYTIDKPFTSVEDLYANSNVKPVDSYARAMSWKDALDTVKNNQKEDSTQVNHYILRTGLSVAIQSIQAPLYSNNNKDVTQKYTFDKVTYQKTDKTYLANFDNGITASDDISKPSDIIDTGSGGRTYISTKAKFPLLSVSNAVPLTGFKGDSAAIRSNDSSSPNKIAYAWCGRLSNLTKHIANGDDYAKLANTDGFNYDKTTYSDSDTDDGTTANNYMYNTTYSKSFKRYSVLYRIIKKGNPTIKAAKLSKDHKSTDTCHKHDKKCLKAKYSTQHDDDCPLHIGKNDTSNKSGKNPDNLDTTYCTCTSVTCSNKSGCHTYDCPYKRIDRANKQYTRYFGGNVTEEQKKDNMKKLYALITTCNESHILSRGELYIDESNLTGYKKKDDVLTKIEHATGKMYLGTYDELYDRSYITGNYFTTMSNSYMASEDALKIIKDMYIEGKYNDETGEYIFNTANVSDDYKAYKNSQAIYPETNLYHWETAPKSYYMSHDNKVYTRSWKVDSDDDDRATAYYKQLVFAFDWYRAQPISEVTVWYKPATYTVDYHTNLPVTGDSIVNMKSDTSLTEKKNVSTDLVFYDNYSLSAPEQVFDNWSNLQADAANHGYTFDHWNICLAEDANANTRAKDNNQVGTHFNDTVVSINPKTEASALPFNINTDSRYPFQYNNVMNNKNNKSHKINVYAVWKKAEYAVYYNSNEATPKIFPRVSTLTTEALGAERFNKGYMPGNSGQYKSDVMAVEDINTNIAASNNKFLRPGYFIIGWSLFNTGNAEDHCGTDYYGGVSHDNSKAWSNHTNLVRNATGADAPNKLYSADAYSGGRQQTAALKRNSTNFSPYNRLTSFGNLMQSNRNQFTVTSITQIPVSDYTVSPLDSDNIYYGPNYVITMTNQEAYNNWCNAVEAYNNYSDTGDLYNYAALRAKYIKSFEDIGNAYDSIILDLRDFVNDCNLDMYPKDTVLSGSNMKTYITAYNAAAAKINNFGSQARRLLTKINDNMTGLSESVHSYHASIEKIRNQVNDLNSNYAELLELIAQINSSSIYEDMTPLFESIDEDSEPYTTDKYSFSVHIFIDMLKDHYKELHNVMYHNGRSEFEELSDTLNSSLKDSIDSFGDSLNMSKEEMLAYVKECYYAAFQVTPAAVFYAHWEPDRFYVRYNQNDANVASSRNPDGIQLSGNSKVEADPQPTYPGHTSLLLYPGQFSNKSVYYGDPTVTYASNQWQRINAYNSIDKTEQSDYLGWSDVVTTDGAGAYTAKFGDGTNFNYGEMLKTVFNSADGSPQVDDLTDKYYNYIYNLYAIFDDWPIMYIQEQAEKSGYSMLYDTASSLLTGASGVTSDLLDAHTKTELETHLLSSDANGNYRLPIIAYDREDSASNSSAVTNNNTWNKIAGPQVIQNRPDCTEVNRPTGVVTWIGANGYADPTAFPASLGYVNGSSNQGNMSNIAQIYIDPTGSNRKADDSVGVRNTYYHLRFFDPSYVLNKVDNTQETKFELRYFIKDSRGKGYERQANFYVGANAKINIMDNP